MEFSTWNDLVKQEMARMDVRPGRPGAIIDAMIPYRLGWTPQRTARALMRYDYADHNTLHRLAIDQARQQESADERPDAADPDAADPDAAVVS
jgi:hypothetical protein